MAQTVTIRLSDLVLNYLKQIADLTNRPVDEIVEQSLVHSLPPLLEEIPHDFQVEVYPLLQMSDSELKQEMLRTFPLDRWESYDALLEKKKTKPLSSREQSRLRRLRHEADVLTYRKAYAAVLLKRRGYRIPSANELPLPQ